MRMRKKKNLDKRLDACKSIIIENPETQKGLWDKNFAKGRKICLEIGCGKGTFAVTSAQRNPENFYIALEVVPDVLVLAAEKAIAQNTENLVFICFDAAKLFEIFEKNEIDEIYLNFSDPWPKARHAKRRLTYISFLNIYKEILKNGGKIFFKTDNRPLFDFSLEQFGEANIPLSDVTNDLHNSPWEEGNIHTEYEDNFSAKGFCINRLVGTIEK